MTATRRRMTWRTALFGLLVAGAVGPAWGQTPEAPLGGPKSEAMRVLAELQAAHEARVEESRILREGREEQLELQGRTAVAELQTIAANQRKKAARAALAELQAQQAPLTQREQQIEGLMAEVAEQIHGRLDALAARTPPGAVPPRPSPEPRQPEARLDAAFERMEAAERRAQQIDVTVAEGELEGERRSVQVLRVGAAVAWWIGLEGDQAGWVEVDGGELRLRLLEDADAREAIARAVRIAKGRAAPELVPLPLPGADG